MDDRLGVPLGMGTGAFAQQRKAQKLSALCGGSNGNADVDLRPGGVAEVPRRSSFTSFDYKRLSIPYKYKNPYNLYTI